jgi:hypothetical protein
MEGEPTVAPSTSSSDSVWTGFLPDIAELVVEYLDDIDLCGYLNQICKGWKIKATERCYSRLCHRVYLRQTERKQLQLNQWGSWRRMLIHRPRIRTNGVYWLRTSYFKCPVNDRFWEERITEYVEVSRIIDVANIFYESTDKILSVF